MTSPIDTVGPVATLPANYDPTRATLNGTGSGQPTEMLDSQAFLQLLVAQLKYQDPTNPVDTSNFMNQTAMLSQVQTMNFMSTTLSDMLAAQQTASATNMLGKVIAFVDPAGNQTEGIVDAVSMMRGTAMLHVGDLAVPLSGVLAVAEPIPISEGGIDPQDGTIDPVTDGSDIDDATPGSSTDTTTSPTDSDPGDTSTEPDSTGI